MLEVAFKQHAKTCGATTKRYFYIGNCLEDRTQISSFYLFITMEKL
jgi:hypothetical protein